MGGTAQTRAGEQAPSCFCPCKTVKPPLPQGSLLRGGWALCAQHGSGECGQLGLQAWASPCPQPLAVPPSPLWPRSWPPAFLLGTEREASGPLQAGGGCGVWPVPWALGSWGQTLGPHSQLQGWMGPGHLLFNSPGSPGVGRGPTERSEKRWESPQLDLAPGGSWRLPVDPCPAHPQALPQQTDGMAEFLEFLTARTSSLAAGPAHLLPCGWWRAFPLPATSAWEPPALSLS